MRSKHFAVALLAGFACISTVQAALNPATGIGELANGSEHACLRTAIDGRVRCWGNNFQGQLGDNSVNFRRVPTDTGLSGITALAPGGNHSCALRSSGVIACWGSNSFGQLGIGSADAQVLVPTDITAQTGFASVASGVLHSCGRIAANNRVACWGDGAFGQIGDGLTDPATTPVGVTDLLGAVTQLVAGDHFTCILNAAGEVWCWGRNEQHQLGVDNSTTPGFISAAPLRVLGLPGTPTRIAAGAAHACALIGGAVYCWGSNSTGQLGDPGSPSRPGAEAIMDGEAALQATALGLGTSHSCAVTTAGAVKCWGAGGSGALGQGETASSDIPVQVSGIDGSSLRAVSVDAGDQFSCARLSNGEARCWGVNVYGRLGNNSGTLSNVPVTVLFEQPVVTLSPSATSLLSGASLTLTATVTGTTAATGEVAFYDGSSVISGCGAVTLNAATPPTATCATSSLAVGTRQLFARYAGDGNNAAASVGPVAVTVSNPPTLRVHTFNFLTNPASFGTPITAIFEDTQPLTATLNTATPITTHLLIADNTGLDFSQLTFSAASDNTALLPTNSFAFYNGEWQGQKYKAVTISPVANASGSATVTYSVFGPGNALLATTATTVAVVAVNDPPRLRGGIVQGLQLASRYLIDGGAGGIVISGYSTGPADEGTQATSFGLSPVSSSSPSPVQSVTLGTPEFAADQPGLVSSSLTVSSTGQAGWHRFDFRVQENGAGTCRDLGEAPPVEAGFGLIKMREQGYGTAADAIERLIGSDGALSGFDAFNVFPLESTCSRRTPMYFYSGPVAAVDVQGFITSKLPPSPTMLIASNAELKGPSSERYFLLVSSFGSVPLPQTRVRVAQPAGVASMQWSCLGTEPACMPQGGTGAIDLSVNLGLQDIIVLVVDATFDGATPFVQLNVDAIVPAGLPTIAERRNRVTLTQAASASGILLDGFER